ncbi:Phosphatidylinositol/phosphatidylcholine transfer protein SFH8 [Hondaea fermentalgiana]|uniref:Phosphatidylinositol/phosphatidylcholine transfer protein SFH8 n=1 Tax=Hondaea fermentalgiana TaxID=2315210 RepID=A0A2R5GQG0_9STRA|nr:Phosphatidylinositol/phosphatidylcholine transfer protein SFH8 [Hondaea fermentalgiana]|eukprot:GBG32549.1 Phosphatidylinositol/phosphatidylcholine transfer protein SFH8 [Hondaea fermentalgiana]
MGKHTYENLEIVQKATIILAEYVEHLAGPTGLMTVVYSRLDATRKNMDFDVVKVVAGLMQDNYPERLHQAMAAPTGPLLRGAWKVVQLFFDPRTRAKLCLVKDVDGFKDAVDASSLPTEIGGTCTEPLSVQPIVEFAEQAWAASRTET